MTDAVPRLNLAPKLNRPLQLWNPLDYLRLLYWVFYFPQALRWYQETFVAPKYRGVKGKALWQAFMQDIVLRQFILQAFVLCLFAAQALAWAMEQAGLPISWGVVAFGVAVGVTLGVAVGVAGGVAVGVALGVAVSVASGVALGVALGPTLGLARGAEE